MIPLRSKARRSAEQTREHVLDVAYDLFYWHGIRATGVDRVAAEAGIAPAALYRLFPSKDALVAAYVERTEQRYRAWFDAATIEDCRSAAERVDALFVALREQTRPDVCRGCPFMMALSELPDESLEGHRSAVRLKKWVRAPSKDSPKTTPALTRAERSTRVPSPITSACCSKVSMPPCKRSAMTAPPSELANSPRY